MFGVETLLIVSVWRQVKMKEFAIKKKYSLKQLFSPLISAKTWICYATVALSADNGNETVFGKRMQKP